MGLHTLARQVPALDHRIRQAAAAEGSAGGCRGRHALTDRDQDERRDLPGEAPDDEQVDADAEDAPTAGPSPATWAGRQRSSPEDADEPDQTPADEAEEAQEPAAEPESSEESAESESEDGAEP